MGVSVVSYDPNSLYHRHISKHISKHIYIYLSTAATPKKFINQNIFFFVPMDLKLQNFQEIFLINGVHIKIKKSFEIT